MTQTPAQYRKTLKGACPDGLAWARAQKQKVTSDQEAWDILQRPDWMFWLTEHRGIKLDEGKLRHYACDCAEQVLEMFSQEYPTDKRPRHVIETARRFADGKASREDLGAAWAAASDAAWAAASDAARAAAGDAAKDAASDAACAAACAAGDAWASAAACDVARAAAWAAARDAAWAWQADRLRFYFPTLPEAK